MTFSLILNSVRNGLKNTSKCTNDESCKKQRHIKRHITAAITSSRQATCVRYCVFTGINASFVHAISSVLHIPAHRGDGRFGPKLSQIGNKGDKSVIFFGEPKYTEN